jgi:hypothetical protein
VVGSKSCGKKLNAYHNITQQEYPEPDMAHLILIDFTVALDKLDKIGEDGVKRK